MPAARTPSEPRRGRLALRFAGRTLAALAIAALIVVAGGAFAIQRADSILNQLLHDFATNTVRERSNGIYQLAVGRLHFNWALRHVSLDSAVLTTDTLANERQARASPTIRVGLYGCTVSGVGLLRLASSRGLYASRFGCGVVVVQLRVPPALGPAQPSRPDTTEARGENPAFLVFQRGLTLPRSAPRIHVSRIDFPHASFVYSQPTKRGEARVALEHLEWHIRDLVIDPADPLAARRPLFSRTVDLTADNITFHPDSVRAVGVSRIQLRLVDSTLAITGMTFGPTVSDARFENQRPWRRTRVRLSASQLRATGIDLCGEPCARSPGGWGGAARRERTVLDRRWLSFKLAGSLGSNCTCTP